MNIVVWFYDNWKLSSGRDNEKVHCYCKYCNGEIYLGESYIKTVEGEIHEHCWDGFAKDILEYEEVY